MSLATRLLVALVSLAVLVTALVGFSARDVARKQVEQGFDDQMKAAIKGVRDEFEWEATTLAELLTPLCRHDSFIGRTLTELQRVRGAVGELPPGRRIAFQEIVKDQRKALRLDELQLVIGSGVVLGASDVSLIGIEQPRLAQRLKAPERLVLVGTGKAASLEVHCARSADAITLGLVGSRRIAPILRRVGAAYGVSLNLTDPAYVAPQGTRSSRLAIDEIPGLEVTATVSREPLTRALSVIDRSILLSGGIAVLLAIALAVFIASGLSRPIVELTHQTRAVVRGKPRRVRGRGGRELRDLATSFNRTIEELTAMRKRLAATERIAARREIARQVAHEIKNPLAPIRASVETLRRLRARQDTAFDEYFDEATTTVLREVHRIQQIVSEFTKFARLPPPEFAWVELAELARSVVALHDAKGDPQGPAVSLSVEPLPKIWADPDQLVQVLTNLVQNGIEAVESTLTTTKQPIEVNVALAPVKNHGVCIRVSDNGPGIEPTIRDKLFEPYVSTKPQGTGLGLAIVQRIVFEHGGAIEAYSEPSGGAVVSVTLPVDGPVLLERAPASDDQAS